MTHPARGSQTKHGCIIMASGTSTRFGANKLIAELGGMPLIQHVLRATDGLYSRRVVVTRHSDVARLCDMRGVEAVLHDEPLRNDTVRLGMEKMADCDTVTFVQGDQPLVSANSLAALLRGAESHPDCIWRASFRGTPGAPVLFPSWSFDELRSLPPGKGGGVVAKAHKERVRTIEVSSKWELFDVDTPDDLQTLQAHLENGLE
ncbi:nucleotidyltransferase family protein [Ellagibacter isourolithinifaciens]|uniref:nucleotidyltransferase family protein n=1 Tax=Ellagibacter isourolithinifaciens TaxID=2137581 RepID=UPI003A902E49